jgi:hypothetical protein
MRPRPLKDENLDSWAMRLAYANATTATYFAKRVLGLDYSLRQLDNYPNFELVKALELATGLPYSKVVDTTFSHFQWAIPGKVYFKGKETVGSISFHRAHSLKKGLLEHTHRVCPFCWKEDEIPYIRRKWRLRFWRTCPIHKIFLIDKCKICGNTFKASYRHHSFINNHGKIAVCICSSCGKDVRYQHQMSDDSKEFVAVATLENLYYSLLEMQTFSCEDAIVLSGLRKIVRVTEDIYPPITVLIPRHGKKPFESVVTELV